MAQERSAKKGSVETHVKK